MAMSPRSSAARPLHAKGSQPANCRVALFATAASTLDRVWCGALSDALHHRDLMGGSFHVRTELVARLVRKALADGNGSVCMLEIAALVEDRRRDDRYTTDIIAVVDGIATFAEIGRAHV